MAAGHRVPADLAIALNPAIPWQIVWVLLALSSTKSVAFFCLTNWFSQSTTADAQKVDWYHNKQRDQAV